MRYLTALGALVLFVMFSVVLNAQDAARAEELLKWFPQGKYMTVSHRNDLRLAQGDAFDLYQKFFEPPKPDESDSKDAKKEGDKEVPPGNFGFFSRGVAGMSAGRILPKDQLELPEALQEGLYGVTTAAAMSLADEPQGEGDRVKTFALEREDGKGEGTQMGVFIMENAGMAVYQYEDLNTTIASALEKNVIARTGARLGGRPIYSFSLSRAGHRSADRFAWASDTGELLVAPDRKTLRKMYLAGQGRMARMLDEPSYVDLISVLPELGAKWSMHILLDMNRQMAESFEDQGMDDEKLEKMRQRQLQNPMMQIDSLDVGERLVSRSYRVYEESNAAETAMQQDGGEEIAQMAGVEPWNEYQQMLEQRKQTELRDNIIVTTVEVDEKLLKAEQSANAAMQQQLMKNNGTVTFSTSDGKVMKLEMVHAEDGKDVTITTKDGENKKKK